jgi:hypothetical protein
MAAICVVGGTIGWSYGSCSSQIIGVALFVMPLSACCTILLAGGRFGSSGLTTCSDSGSSPPPVSLLCRVVIVSSVAVSHPPDFVSNCRVVIVTHLLLSYDEYEEKFW